MRKIVVGVIGQGEGASRSVIKEARKLGALIAGRGWILLSGGRRVGVMNASIQGASEAGGLTIGILPGNNASNASKYLDIAIITDLNNARNNIISLTSDIIIGFPGKAGTLSEIALGIKNRKNVILLGFDVGKEFYKCSPGSLHVAYSAKGAIKKAECILKIENC